LCWGNGTSGQLGPAASEQPHLIAGLETATKLFLGGASTCARVPSGPLLCVGDLRGRVGGSDKPAPLTAVADAVEVDGATLFSCARRTSGAVSCWGSNLVGELGNGGAPDPNQKIAIEVGSNGEVHAPEVAGGREGAPVDVTGLTDATAIAVGGSHTCALRKTGVVVCWGQDDVGQLGDGRTGYSMTSDHPVEAAGLTGVLGIAVGERVSCARTADAVSCWGSLSEKYPHDAETPVIWATPTKIAGLPAVEDIAAIETSACARTKGGEVLCWGSDGKVYGRGIHQAVQLAGGWKHLCARLASGGITCWGENLNGQLGAREVGSTGLVDVPGVDHAIDLAAGAAHTCVLRAAAR
jgi:alpha-tubulin suppressor-like RCC1 family protein